MRTLHLAATVGASRNPLEIATCRVCAALALQLPRGGKRAGKLQRPGLMRRHEGQVLHAAITAATATGAAHAATAAHTGRRPGDAGAVTAGPARGAQAGQDDRTRLHA